MTSKLQDAEAERAQGSAPAASADVGAAQSEVHAPEVMHQKRTARKTIRASLGRTETAAAPASPAAPASAASAQQQKQSSSVMQSQDLPSVPELSQIAPAAQRLGTGGITSEKGQQQPAPFDLSAAMRGRQPVQAPANSARPDLAKQNRHSTPAPAERRSPPNASMPAPAMQQPAARTHTTTQAADTAHATGPAQATGRSLLPRPMPGPLGKRAAEPSSEPSAKRAKQSDGSLLILAKRVMRDFARERHGGAGGDSRVRCPGF